MKASTILVAGATGFLGYEICQQLRAKNLSVKAMVRATSDPVKIDHLKKLGVQIAPGDIRKKETLPLVLQGVTTVITTISAIPFTYIPGENDIQIVDENGVFNLIDAAKSAGVDQFIYTSFSKNIDSDFPIRNAKRKVEKHLQNSDLTYTILRPSYYMEGWLSAIAGFDALNGKVNIYGSGTNPVAYISRRDVAKFAVECVSNPLSRNAILELGGPQNISQLDAVKIFEELLHKKIEIQYIPVDALQAQFSSSTDSMQKSFPALMICIANGDKIDMKEVLSRYPIKQTSVKDYVQSVMATQLSTAE